jgi:hypothetical protein
MTTQETSKPKMEVLEGRMDREYFYNDRFVGYTWKPYYAEIYRDSDGGILLVIRHDNGEVVGRFHVKRFLEQKGGE